MSQDAKDHRILIRGDKARAELLKGAKFVYDAVSTTYGPKGRNVLAEKIFGRPLLTRDGVTVAREAYLKDRAPNMGAQLILEASETSNRVAGDGSSATAILAYNLLKHGSQAIAGGMHPMDVKQQLLDDSYILLDELSKLSKPVKKSQLQEVATVSSGDPVLGQLIAETIEHVGVDGGIITEKSYVQDIEREFVNGYYLQQGFQALQAGKKELSDPYVIVSSKRISSPTDIIDILQGIAKVNNLQPGQIPKVLFVGNIEEAAYNVVVDNINRQTIDAIVIKTPPMFGDMGPQLLEDIAAYSSCEAITETTNLRQFVRQTGQELSSPYVGSVNKVVATHTESTIFADNDSEIIKDRIQAIKDRIEGEISDAVIEKLRDRIAKLEGKIALFRIGGATDTQKEETEFRVEDAIQATRAAQKSGVVAGGGVTLVELSKCSVSDIYQNALRDTFKKLLTNANLPAEVKLAELLQAPKGHGFSLKIVHYGSSDLYPPVDMVKEGILDPTLVVEQVITNATSVSANALTTDVLLVFEDREEK